MANFDLAHKFTAKWEGGISDHPADRGGYTAYGVCEEFLKDLFTSASGRTFLSSLGFSPYFDKQEMKKKVTKAIAAKIFRYAFWDALDLDGMKSQSLATIVYDMAVNHGAKAALRMLQQALNNSLKSGLKVDGIIGPKTRAACGKADRKSCLELLRIRENYYIGIAANRPSQKVFLKGWLNRKNDLEKYIQQFTN